MEECQGLVVAYFLGIPVLLGLAVGTSSDLDGFLWLLNPMGKWAGCSVWSYLQFLGVSCCRFKGNPLSWFRLR